MMKKPPEHLPALKEEVWKIGSRKDGTSMKRLFEGIDRVRELMVAWQNSTPIRTQCDVDSHHQVGEFVTTRQIPRQFATCLGSQQQAQGGRQPTPVSRPRCWRPSRQQLEGQPLQQFRQFHLFQLLQ